MSDQPTTKGEQASNVILDVAEELFLSQGYTATSMRNIAEAAGYKSVAGLYNHFPKKEHIFVALLRAKQPYEEVLSTLMSLEGHTMNAVIPQLIHKITALVNKHIRFLQLVMIDFLEFDGAHVRDMLTQFQPHLFQGFLRVNALENMNNDVPPAVVIRVLAMQIFGFVMTANLMPTSLLDTLTEDEWKQQIADVLLHGLLKKEPTFRGFHPRKRRI